MKQEYQMTAEDHATLIHACKPTPVMFLSGGMPMHDSPQENANRAWAKLGSKMGFVPMTVEPISGKPNTFFRAEPAADPIIEEMP